MFILSDAYYQTGSMEVGFCGPARGQATYSTGHETDVPQLIRDLATELEVPVDPAEVTTEEWHNTKRTRLSDRTGRELYARITGFSPRVVATLNRPDSVVDLIQACFIVQRGVWKSAQVEFLAVEALDPTRILQGGTLPERRLSFLHDMTVLRTALAWERTKIILESLSGSDDADVHCQGWSGDSAVFVADKDLVVDLHQGTCAIQAGSPISVLMVARSREAYAAMRIADVHAAKTAKPMLYVVTRDYAEVAWADLGPEGERQKTLCLHDTLAELDAEIYKRLARSASTRREMPEHAE